MKRGYYWYYVIYDGDWIIVRIDGMKRVWHHGSDVDQSIEEAKTEGEFGPRIPQRVAKVGPHTMTPASVVMRKRGKNSI